MAYLGLYLTTMPPRKVALATPTIRKDIKQEETIRGQVDRKCSRT